MREKWLRVRFSQPDVEGDYRPVKWPPPGPYWCTGYNADDECIIVAFVRAESQVREFWPGAAPLDFCDERDEITFTSRFPEPEWWAALTAGEIAPPPPADAKEGSDRG